ncbi:ANTAR domain-containing protein [Catellatospora tritici]|uniref:ANTAR domain-containing protein n=1 Tax=Catellatospora tritici TaxID=2851566 RepID=UPI001C2D1A71|nr:ANTAR domain-containing protein [Catellatospora tritici]MBV1856352.1 ANTAR domain-containing protein [Catellatospora tritici]
MIDERVMRVWAQVGKHTQGASVTVADICTAAAAGVGVDGAAVTLVAGTSTVRETVHATDPIALELEQWQSAFGHGPGVDAYATGGPVFAVDLAAPAEQIRWPDFARSALTRGVRAVFALPMQVGAIRLGVVDLHRAGPGLMSPYELADALAFAESAALLLLDGAAGAPADTAELAWQRDESSACHAEVHQATGMLAARLGITAGSALARLRAAAFAHGRRLGDVAYDVIADGRVPGGDTARRTRAIAEDTHRLASAELVTQGRGLP